MTNQIFFARWVFPVSNQPIPHGFVAFTNNEITAIGSIQDLSPSLQAEYQAQSHQNTLITPGFINSHTHLELSFGYSIEKKSDQTMADWLLAVVQSTREASSTKEKAERCQKGIQEVLQTGTTCVNDITSDGTSLAYLDQAGLRGIVSLEFFHPGHEQLYLETLIQQYQTLSKSYENHPRLLVGLSPHSPYNVSPKAWQAALEACQPAIVHTHLAETTEELEWLAHQGAGPLSQVHQTLINKTFTPQISGLSPTQYLHHFDLLESRLIAAHAVYLNELDRRLIHQSGTRLAHCPRSNAHLSGVTLDAKAAKENGISFGLGTDSHLSCPNLDLRGEARHAMAVHGWTAHKALARLTQHGAAVIGNPHIGSLAPGQKADLVLWHAEVDVSLMDSPEALIFDPTTQVTSVWIDGKRCFQNA